jgi:hypothetical protein
MAPALLAQKLSKGSTNTPIDPSDQVTGGRKHFYDGMPELRVTFVSVDVVGLDLATEEDSSESHAETVEETDIVSCIIPRNHFHLATPQNF